MEHLTLHIGAHKTATTSIQQILKWNVKRLAHAGIHYVINPKRAKFYISDEKPCALAEARSALLDDAPENASKIIFSDEDCLRPATISDPVTIYRDIDTTLSRLSSLAAEARDARVLFAIRDYAGFIPSIYQQEVKRGRIGEAFDVYVKANVDLEKISWKPIIHDLALRFGQRLTVWDHRIMFRAPDMLWQAFGIPSDVSNAFNYPNAPSNRALSALGLSLMREVHGQIPAPAVRELERFAARYLRVSETLPAEPNFDADTAAALSARYNDDLSEIEDIAAENGSTFLKTTGQHA